jgi:hypothetical protein
MRPRVAAAWLPRLLAVAAVLAMIVAGAWLVATESAQAWRVTRLAGAPVIGASSVSAKGELRVGDTLVTDGSSRAQVNVGVIGRFEVAPNSQLRVVRSQVNDYRVALDRGRMDAFIWAPPKLFFVETPSALAVDLGCVYSLEVDDAGVGTLRVTRGWVAFEQGGKQSFVPAGAMCLTRPKLGPGTPYFQDASQELKNAIERYDGELAGIPGGIAGGITGGVAGGVPGGVEGGIKGGVEGGVEGGIEGVKKRRAEAISTVLREARKEDRLTLWHLLARASAEERLRIYDRFAEVAPPPEGVTREGILRGDAQMLARWWSALGLGDTTWWGFWRGPVPAPL